MSHIWNYWCELCDPMSKVGFLHVTFLFSLPSSYSSFRRLTAQSCLCAIFNPSSSSVWTKLWSYPTCCRRKVIFFSSILYEIISVGFSFLWEKWTFWSPDCVLGDNGKPSQNMGHVPFKTGSMVTIYILLFFTPLATSLQQY